MKRRKKETAFQYSKRLLQRRQERLLSEISRLEKEGYTVDKAVKKQAEDLQAGVFTGRQARQKLLVHTVGRVRAHAYKETVLARQVISGTTRENVKVTREAPPIVLKEYYGKSGRDVAKQLIKDIKYEFKEHPTLDQADFIVKTFKHWEMLTGIKLMKRPKNTQTAWNREHIVKTMNAMAPGDLAKVLERVQSIQKDAPQQFIEGVYSSGHATPEGYAAFKEVQLELARSTFKKRNADLTDEQIDRIYDFFKNSKQWELFRSFAKGSYTVSELSQFVDSNKGKNSIDLEAFDLAIISSAQQNSHIKLHKILRTYRKLKKSRSRKI